MSRNTIVNRKILADERGLLLSLPTSLIYQFKDDVTNIVKLYIYGRKSTMDECCFTIEFDSKRNCFITNDSSSQFTKETTLYSTMLSPQNNYICGITLEYNKNIDCIDIYDAYYYKNANISKIDFTKYKFTFLYLTDILTDIESKGFEVLEPNNIGFIIDSYTNVVIGALSESDVCFSRYNQLYMNLNDFRLLRVKELYGVENVLDMVGKFYFKNNQFVRITPDNISNELSSIINMQSEIVKLRDIQCTVNDMTLRTRLFDNYEDIQALQNEKKHKDIFIERKWSEIIEFQNNVSELKKNKVTNALNMYINNYKYTYNTSICLLIKDENDFLEEWLDNYWNIGVEHFYIYDNNSKTPVLETISKIKNGFYSDKCDVILFTEYKHMQFDCYENCLINFGNESRWIGFLDTDEFVEFTDNTTDIKEFLHEFENDFAVWIPWETYNANGHINKPIGKMRDNYTQSITNPYGLWGKLFVQSALVQRMFVHGAKSIGNYYPVVTQEHTLLYEEYGQLFNSMKLNNESLYPRVKINHYITRSYQDWVEKMYRGSCDPVFKRKFDTFFGYNPDMKYLKDDISVVEKMQLEQKYY